MNLPSAIAPMFASLDELQGEHMVLVKAVGTNILAPPNLDLIVHFVRRCLAMGTILDAPADRDAVQSLITFWVVRLGSASRSANEKSLAPVPEFDDTLLSEFSPNALVAAVVVPADEWLNQQPALEQALARRIVLRLIRLRVDETFDRRLSDWNVGDALEPPDVAKRVLDELVRLGVIRTGRDAVGRAEVALGSDVLLERWPRLREWMSERLRFRQLATTWAQRRADKAYAAVPSFALRVNRQLRAAAIRVGGWIVRWYASLLGVFQLRSEVVEELSEAEYEEAETYRDKNAEELKLVYQKRQSDKFMNEQRQVLVVAMGFFTALFAVLFAWALLRGSN